MVLVRVDSGRECSSSIAVRHRSLIRRSRRAAACHRAIDRGKGIHHREGIEWKKPPRERLLFLDTVATKRPRIIDAAAFESYSFQRIGIGFGIGLGAGIKAGTKGGATGATGGGGAGKLPRFLIILFSSSKTFFILISISSGLSICRLMGLGSVMLNMKLLAASGMSGEIVQLCG